MTASRPEPGRYLRRRKARLACGAAGAIAVYALAAGCHTPSGLPIGSPLELLASLPSTPPDQADHAAAELAAAALISDREAAVEALARLEVIDDWRRESGQKPTGLVPVATDVIHATLRSNRAYR